MPGHIHTDRSDDYDSRLVAGKFGGQLNGSQILTAIQQNADDLGQPGADPFYGKGRMNTCRTLPGCVPVANPTP